MCKKMDPNFAVEVLEHVLGVLERDYDDKSHNSLANHVFDIIQWVKREHVNNNDGYGMGFCCCCDEPLGMVQNVNAFCYCDDCKECQGK